MIDDIPFLAEPTPWNDGPQSPKSRVLSPESGTRDPGPGTPDSRPAPLRIEPGAKFALPRIRAIADKVVAALAPLCERIEIAGSIRRGRALVGDIDLVILPKDRAAIRAKLVPACNVLADGPQNLLVDWPLGRTERLQLDIFFAHDGVGDFFAREPSNWGTLLLCRTGSKEFNIWFAQQAQRAGLHWNPYRGLTRQKGLSQQSEVIAAATEDDLFKALEITPIKPEVRER